MVNIDISEENNAEKDDSNNNIQPKDEKLCRVIWQVIDLHIYETSLIHFEEHLRALLIYIKIYTRL